MTNLNLVNKLLEKSFGKGFFGNYEGIIDPLGADKIRGKKIAGIAKRTWKPIPLIMEVYLRAGKFTSEDGSSLEVFPEYLNQAKEYSDLYKKETGKEVLVKEMKLSPEELALRVAEKIFNLKFNPFSFSIIDFLFNNNQPLVLTEDQIFDSLKETGLLRYISPEETISIKDCYIEGGKGIGIKKVDEDKYTFKILYMD